MKASNADANDSFGESVAIDGDVMVVGAPWERSDGSDPGDNSFLAGAAYVFERDGCEWSEVAYLKAPSPEGGEGFGATVAVDGDVIVVGADRSNEFLDAGRRCVRV